MGKYPAGIGISTRVDKVVEKSLARGAFDEPFHA